MDEFLIDLIKSVLIQLVCDTVHKYSEPPKHYSVDVGSISASMDITQEDLKYMRELATKEQVNSYLNAKVSIDMRCDQSETD